jgi:polar amino acid transport system substrate-binding protein
MRMSPFIAIALTAVLAAGATHFLLRPEGDQSQITVVQPAYQRIMQTGTIRCAYYVFSNASMRDASSGKLSGMMIDMMEAIGADTNLQIDWVEEVNFGNVTAGLQSGRYDAVCTPSWPSSALAREAYFSLPMFYAGITPFVRVADSRFDDDLSKLNHQDIRIAVQEGTPNVDLVRAIFPQAQIMISPPNAPAGEDAMNVVGGKADVVLWDINGAFEFMKNNPGSLRQLAATQPLKIMPFVLLVPRGETDLKFLLDAAVQNLQNTGTMARLIDRWQPAPGTFYKAAAPFAAPPAQ